MTQPPWPVDAHGKLLPRTAEGWPDFRAVNWPVMNGQWAPVGLDGRPVVYGDVVPASPTAFPPPAAGLPAPGQPFAPPTPQPGKPLLKRRGVQIALSVFGLLVVLGAIGAATGGKSKTASVTSASTSTHVIPATAVAESALPTVKAAPQGSCAALLSADGPVTVPSTCQGPQGRVKVNRTFCIGPDVPNTTLYDFAAQGKHWWAYGGTSRPDWQSSGFDSAKRDCNPPPWFPKGYQVTGQDDNVAYEWVQDPQCTSFVKCTQANIVVNEDCPTLYLEVSTETSDGVAVGYSNDVLSGLHVGDRGLMTFNVTDEAASKVAIDKVTCY
ncbi:hypothetical protein [Humibacter sp.]|uniref:hypothetical protein n=1 Tax=Humibacter sp. TaxID=1940291 RepID=UPI002C720C08|nr:hypothetical protein [Humibacter sp.]HVX07180.1 hypothetical protein [Humibacter sp.]